MWKVREAAYGLIPDSEKNKVRAYMRVVGFDTQILFSFVRGFCILFKIVARYQPKCRLTCWKKWEFLADWLFFRSPNPLPNCQIAAQTLPYTSTEPQVRIWHGKVAVSTFLLGILTEGSKRPTILVSSYSRRRYMHYSCESLA